MITEELGSACFVDIARGNEQHELSEVVRVGFEAPAIVDQKRIRRCQGGSLIAVD